MNVVLELSCHIPNQPPRWHIHHDPHPPLPVAPILVCIIADHFSLPHRQFLYHPARILLPHQNRHLLYRLQHLWHPRGRRRRAVVWVWTQDGLRWAHSEFKPFPPQCLKEHPEVEYPPAADLNRVGGGAGEDTKGGVDGSLFEDSLAYELGC